MDRRFRHRSRPSSSAAAAVGPIADDFSGDGNMSGRITTSGGKTWVLGGDSSWSTSGGTAFQTAGNGTLDAGAPVYLDSLLADCTIQVTVPHSTGDQRRHGILFRYVDDNNFWSFFNYLSGATRYWFLQSKVAGVTSHDSNTTSAPASSQVYQVVLLGTSIKCYADGVQKFNITSSSHQSATKHGMLADQGNPFDDFSVT